MHAGEECADRKAVGDSRTRDYGPAERASLVEQAVVWRSSVSASLARGGGGDSSSAAAAPFSSLSSAPGSWPPPPPHRISIRVRTPTGLAPLPFPARVSAFVTMIKEQRERVVHHLGLLAPRNVRIPPRRARHHLLSRDGCPACDRRPVYLNDVISSKTYTRGT